MTASTTRSAARGRALARAYAGPRALALCQQLARAETDPDALEPALVELDKLDALDRRRVLGAFARLSSAA